MSMHDDEFIKRLRATFQVEAEEHIQAMSSSLLELEKSPAAANRTAIIETVYREAHSLKGAARAVDLREIEAICQSLESVFSIWKLRFAVPSQEAFDALHQAVDAMRSLLATADSDPAAKLLASRKRDELMQRLSKLLISTSASSPDLANEPRRVADPSRDPVGGRVSDPVATPSPAAHPAPAISERTVVGDTVRIPIAKLDARLLQAEDMLTVKAMTAQRATELRELTSRMEQWWKKWAKVSPETRSIRAPRSGVTSGSSGDAAGVVADFLDWNSDFFRSLENRLTSLAAQAEQDRHGVDKRVDDLLEDSKKLLMLPFSTLTGGFPKLVRDLCRDQGKEADLVIRGGEIEIDKRILEEMKDALIHSLRNSIDHGVESPDERLRLKKSPRATITLSASAVNGSKVEIMVSDDGAGVHIERVKESAVHRGFLSQNDAGDLSDADALALVFHSEVSASPIVTALSGRGLGMTIVRSKAEKLGGRVSIESRPHLGTTLRILLPMTMATFRGILVSVADRAFVVPASNVERVVRIKPQDVKTVENRETISVDERIVSLSRLEMVLELPRLVGDAPAPGSLIGMVLHAGGQRIMFAVDHVLHEEEILVKPFRKPLVRVRNIAGATILGSGKVVPILNVTDLIKSARTRSTPPGLPKATIKPSQAPAKRVLVVEDSITSRMLLKGILESAGFQVKVAVDGMDAFTVLREEPFDLVVSDVEMPRLNGFDLTARIRADKRLAELPVVLVTALESRAERERGVDAGANAYIIKSSFDQSNLLQVVRRLI